jgi:hypothetical protein
MVIIFRFMWSDTGSYEFESRGDVVKKINLDQQNYADPVKGSRRTLPSSIQQSPRPYNERKMKSVTAVSR